MPGGDVDLALSEGRPAYRIPIDRAEHETAVAITGIDGGKWTFTVQVASAPER